jgi:dipicolinate synthase subunit B
MIGYAFTGSFCTLKRSLAVLTELVLSGEEIVPIVSERVYSTDTRFYPAREFIERVETICKRGVIHTVEDAEPLGAVCPLDLLIIAPCTGNTLAKISHGVTDSAVTMAAKAHLRCDRPLLVALATNDALSQNLSNIGTLLSRKSVYLLPLAQDDPIGKPHSLVADFARLGEAYDSMMIKKQLRPLFI